MTNKEKINYTLYGFTMGYGQPHPNIYYYFVDDRLKISVVRKYIKNWFSWMKILKVTKIPFDNENDQIIRINSHTEVIINGHKYYVLGYFTQIKKGFIEISK